MYTGTRPWVTPAIRAGKGWRGRRELAPRCSATQLDACAVRSYRQRHVRYMKPVPLPLPLPLQLPQYNLVRFRFDKRGASTVVFFGFRRVDFKSRQDVLRDLFFVCLPASLPSDADASSVDSKIFLPQKVVRRSSVFDSGRPQVKQLILDPVVGKDGLQ